MAYYFKVQSKFQEIAVQSDPLHYGEHVLYLDKTWQYGSFYEYRYHEVIATLPAVMCDTLDRVLICGGGDGLAARELLRFPGLQIDLVEIDAEMIRAYSDLKILTDLNRKSLLNERVKIHIQDALTFADQCQDSYDLILLDFPSPAQENQAKSYENLYSPANLSKFLRILKPLGVLTAQTSLRPNDLVPFVRHLVNHGNYVWNYDCVYNRYGNHDNFTVASKQMLTRKRDIPKECRFVTKAHAEIGYTDATELDSDDLEYYRLFEDMEEHEVEAPL